MLQHESAYFSNQMFCLTNTHRRIHTGTYIPAHTYLHVRTCTTGIYIITEHITPEENHEVLSEMQCDSHKQTHRLRVRNQRVVLKIENDDENQFCNIKCKIYDRNIFHFANRIKAIKFMVKVFKCHIFIFDAIPKLDGDGNDDS